MAGIIILADDLTGACDTGVKLSRLGYDSHVVMSAQEIAAIGEDNNACYTLNTDSRSISSGEAYRKLKGIAGELKALGRARWYKKIDSVLRGNIGSEIDALMEVFGFRFSMIAPALPSNGRTLKNGVLHIENNGGSYDLFAADAIGATTEKSCGVIGIEKVRSGRQAVVQEVEKLIAGGVELILLDAESEQDLATVAAAIQHFGDAVLPAGSAGLAHHLYERSDGAGSAINLVKTEGQKRVVATVIGSRHPATVEQVQRLKQRTDTSFVVFDGDRLAHNSPEELADEAVQKLVLADNIVVTTKKIFDGKTYSGNKVLREDIANDSIAETVTLTAKKVMAKLDIKAVIVSGGDIAGRLIGKLGAARLRLYDEPIAGVAAGVMLDSDYGDLYIATKSGGFGGEQVLDQLVDYMMAVSVTQHDTAISE